MVSSSLAYLLVASVLVHRVPTHARHIHLLYYVCVQGLIQGGWIGWLATPFALYLPYFCANVCHACTLILCYRYIIPTEVILI